MGPPPQNLPGGPGAGAAGGIWDAEVPGGGRILGFGGRFSGCRGPRGRGGDPPKSYRAPPRYTYEVAPVLVLLEEQVLAKLRELVGWSDGDGIFAPGGSMSNMLAMNVARFRRFPESRSRGSRDLPRLAIFASRESHYSILKGAAFLGIGTDNVHLVPTDERWVRGPPWDPRH
ncbi:cysteine sulfinic acid decarboxylase-like, partial [Empidonax traillii]|uniref:cysteine sulfinic acid decarboxylase-like n=1 Tax=Empidonax traillii TaxID=164674 RepID=UPI000FFCF905